MGVFDNLMSGATGLLDWTGGAASDVFDFATSSDGLKSGFAGLQGLIKDQDAEKKARMNSWDNTQRGTVASNKGDFTPGNPRAIPFGLPNYAPDPSSIEAFWNGALRKLVDVKETKVNRSK